MKLIAVDRLLASAVGTAKRFPMTLASAIVAAAAAMTIPNAGSEDAAIRWMAAASIGLPLFTGLTLFAARHRLPTLPTWLLRLAGFGLIALFYWRWAAWSDPEAGLRYFHLSVTLHLAVAVIAYLGVREPNGFWQFNRALFERFLIAGVYSAVLFAGLALALAGIDNLLGFSVDEDHYLRLFFLLGFVFQTWFFLAGVPEEFDRLEESRDYPTGLRVFAQYVLVPLVTVYLLILTLYLGRILVTRTWPSGWIGYLVSALAALGILSLLLVHPERDREDQPWIDRYARLFWLAILPSVVMLLLAVGQRIGQYGMTERRYLLLALAVWLALIALFYAIFRSRDIRIIPLSLGAVGLATLLGPWSAYAVAERSQAARLVELLERHEILVDGRISPRSTEVPYEDWRQVGDVLRYLIEHHGTGAIDPWFEGGVARLDTLGSGEGPGPRGRAAERATRIVEALGIRPAGGGTAGLSGYASLSVLPTELAIPTEGFSYVLPSTSLLDREIELEGVRIRIRIEMDPLELRLDRNGAPWMRAALEPLLDRGVQGGMGLSRRNPQLPRDSLRLDLVAGGDAARVYVEQLTLMEDPEGLRVSSAAGTILLRLGG